MPENNLSGEFELNESPSDELKINNKIENLPREDVLPDGLSRPAKKSSSHFYSSFCYFPKNVKFLNQESDEEIILLIRRRFIVNVPWIAAGILFAIIGPILFPFIISSLPINSISFFQQTLMLSLYLLIVFGFLLTKFTLWYFHVGIVTNKRIKDIDIHGVLFKDIAETRINLIQDVKYSQIGFLPSLFNFGDVFIQTAGSEPNIEFDKAPMPSKVAKIIGDMLRDSSS